MSTTDNPEAMDTDGAMGAGAADAPDLAVADGGDATGGGSPGDPDDMGIDEERTLEMDDDDDLPIGSSDPESEDDLS